MKNKQSVYYIFCVAFFMLCFLNACNHFNAPTEMYPNIPYAAGPSISRVVPSDSAIAGVREITIIGNNFSSVIDSDWVYFGTQRATVKSASAETLVVYRPPNYGLLTLQVVIPADTSMAKINYNLDMPVSSLNISTITAKPIVMEADKQDNIYIGGKGSINKLSSDGLTITPVDTAFLKTKNYKALSNNITDLKFGTGGLLYIVFDKLDTIYTIDPVNGGPLLVYAGLPANSTAKLDFDDNGNIYTGKSNGLYLVKTDKTVSAVGDYAASFVFVEIRVFKDASNNKYVYAANSTSLYKSAINSDGTVGNGQLVVNITTASDTIVRTGKISSFNIASDGTLLLSVTNTVSYSLYVLENNNTLTPYYKENILPTGIDQLIWGNGRYLYLSLGQTGAITGVRLYKMGMAKNGAPYVGRNL